MRIIAMLAALALAAAVPEARAQVATDEEAATPRAPAQRAADEAAAAEAPAQAGAEAAREAPAQHAAELTPAAPKAPARGAADEAAATPEASTEREAGNIAPAPGAPSQEATTTDAPAPRTGDEAAAAPETRAQRSADETAPTPQAPAQGAAAAPGAPGGEAALRVGVQHRPPFAILTDDGSWLGMGVDLWRLAAEDLGLRYTYVELPPGGMAEALRTGAVDLALPANATPSLEKAADLTLPFYSATLGVASARPSRLGAIAEGFLSLAFLRLVLGLSALLLLVGGLVWLLERRRNDQFGGGVLRGLGDGFWWAGVTLTTIGYGDKAPVTILGRAVAMLWMLVGLAVSAGLTAAVVTLAGTGRQVQVPEVFHDRTVGAAEGTTAALFLAREDVDRRLYPTLEAALAALDEGEVEQVAGAWPVLSAAVKGNGAWDFSVRRTELDPHLVGFAVPEGSPLREDLNRLILRRLGSESGLNLLDRYLPEGG